MGQQPAAETNVATGALAGFDPALISSIVDVVADGITVQAADGRIVYANDAAARACGFATAEELLRSSRAEILARFELVDEAGQPLPSSSLPGSSVLRGEPPHDRVVGFRIRETGEDRWSVVSAVPLRGRDGGLEFAVNAFHDITGRKRAEDERDRERTRLAASLSQRLADEARLAELIRSERSRAAELNAIIGAIGEGIVVVDRRGVITHANRAARRMLGTIEGVELETLLGRFEHAGDLRERLRSGAVQARLAGESGRWLEVASYPVDEKGEAGSGGAIVVIRDVTAARERDQARDAFIGMLSHELRTPITTIYAGSKLLAREGGLPEPVRMEIFEDIHGEAERLHRLVEDVVALTRFGEGALEIGSEPVLLQRVLPAVARSEEGRWPEGSFEVHLEPDLPPVAGDATYVEQVVRNLLANAMKYGGPGSTAVVEAVAGEDPNEVVVRVLDRGPGFPADEADHLFDLYYRSPTVARKISGSGIGLFVCSRLIEAMDGRIWATNRPGGGAEFGFALRAMEEDR
ncbi:MAG TPA: ATP-binding protein [Candidatus Limnocylindria bacterium]|nr:ATP-binding protein [Candidatus Limnocylindria bacterium]